MDEQTVDVGPAVEAPAAVPPRPRLSAAELSAAGYRRAQIVCGAAQAPYLIDIELGTV
jgi:hypothetical protein